MNFVTVTLQRVSTGGSSGDAARRSRTSLNCCRAASTSRTAASGRRIRAGAEELRRHTRDDRVRSDVVRDHCARADDGARANGHSGEQHGVHADIRAIFDPHGLDHEVRLDDRDVQRIAGVLAPQHLRAGTPTDVVPELQVPAVEVRLRADPRVRTDDAPAVVRLKKLLFPMNTASPTRRCAGGARARRRRPSPVPNAGTSRAGSRAEPAPEEPSSQQAELYRASSCPLTRSRISAILQLIPGSG